ncbi:hypothetical protein E5Q_00336, partial [Mixia osmundae IAM 14324]
TKLRGLSTSSKREEQKSIGRIELVPQSKARDDDGDFYAEWHREMLAAGYTTPSERWRPSVTSPVLFATGLSAISLGLAAYLTNRDEEHYKHKIDGTRFRSWLRTQSDSHALAGECAALARAREQDRLARLRAWYSTLNRDSKEAVAPLLNRWNRMTEGQRTVAGVIGVYVGVYGLAWVLKPKTFFRLFTHYAPTARLYPLFTSSIAHFNLLHLGANAYALYTFSGAMYHHMGKASRLTRESGARDGGQPAQAESTTRYHFLAFMVCGGVMSSLGSHLWDSRIAYNAVRRALRDGIRATPKLFWRVRPGLGASGAVWSVVSYTALSTPDARLGIIFLPGIDFPIGAAAACLFGIDVLGMLLGWSRFGHAAHATGALFGVFWFYEGGYIFDSIRAKVRQLSEAIA